MRNTRPALSGGCDAKNAPLFFRCQSVSGYSRRFFVGDWIDVGESSVSLMMERTEKQIVVMCDPRLFLSVEAFDDVDLFVVPPPEDLPRREVRDHVSCFCHD
jgi:hypothetical protein